VRSFLLPGSCLVTAFRHVDLLLLLINSKYIKIFSIFHTGTYYDAENNGDNSVDAGDDAGDERWLLCYSLVLIYVAFRLSTPPKFRVNLFIFKLRGSRRLPRVTFRSKVKLDSRLQQASHCVSLLEEEADK
jgi:hypothetical protein